MNFIGSIYFTLIIIPLAALFIAVGTIIESLTSSHQYAAYMTYHNPLFMGLLGCFFANILFSALRRWPFRQKHIPFLLTHLGLLMIIAGVMVKTQWGVQGNLIVWEGSASSQVLSSQENVIVMKSRSGHQGLLPPEIGMQHDGWIVRSKESHSTERIRSWIVDGALKIRGLESSDAIRIHSSSAEPWHISTAQNDPIEAVKTLWLEKVRITIKDRLDQSVLYDGIAKNLPGVRIDDTFHLHWNDVQLELTDNAVPKNKKASYLGAPVTIRIQSEPSLVFVEHGDEITMAAINQVGSIAMTQPKSWVTYEGGFGGNFSQITVPFAEKPTFKNPLDLIKQTLKEVEDINVLSPPLKLLAASSPSFEEPLAKFLEFWDGTLEWFYPLTGKAVPGFPAINWKSSDYKACYWIVEILQPLVDGLARNEDLLLQLKQRGWPLIDDFVTTLDLVDHVPPDAVENALRYLSQQVYLIAEQLPEPPPYREEMNQRLYSAYLRTFGIHLTQLTPPSESPVSGLPTLESPLTAVIEAVEPLSKWEDNRPMVVLENGKEQIVLAYDPSGKKLGVPDKEGRVLFSYQPKPIMIPYRVRVHEAVQTNYSNSNQPFSYQCTLFLNQEKVQLSMNQVHETWDGYRFYLAAISPEDPGKVHQVKIVVNHDPAKYYLTYPGCLILVLGISLFSSFFLRKS